MISAALARGGGEWFTLPPSVTGDHLGLTIVMNSKLDLSVGGYGYEMQPCSHTGVISEVVSTSHHEHEVGSISGASCHCLRRIREVCI